MPSSNFVVSSLPAYVQDNKDIIIKNFALVGTSTRRRIGIQTGIKYKGYLNYLELAPTLQDGKGCGFEAAGTATLSQRTVETAIIKVNMDVCPDSLIGKYAEYLVRINANAQDLPFEQYIMDGIVRELNKKIEKLIWQGDKSQTSDANIKWIDGFLEQFKANPALDLGANVVVLGGGNTAMDVARAARRLPGSPNVRLVYRRTRRYMPADEEELQMALDDGVEFMELLAPERLEDGQLVCAVMALGAPDASGRRSPVATGEVKRVPASAVIAAVGERVDTAVFEAAGCEIDAKGRPVVDADMRTSAAGVYAVGDARRGPATVVEGIADAAAAAAAIGGISFERYAAENAAAPKEKYLFKKGRVAEDVSAVPDWRCLGCPSVCEVCADVCPNRANVAIHVPGKCQAQIVHVDGMCNECGNCAVFCPYSGRPYRDKFTLFWSEEDFNDSENEGFLALGADSVKLRLDGSVQTVKLDALDSVSADAAALIRAILNDYGWLIP